MERLNGGLKDIFSTILSETTKRPEAPAPQISIRGNGNVIAPGGTVHVTQSSDAQPLRQSQKGRA